MGYNAQVEILSLPTMSSEHAAAPEGAIAPHERPFLITGLPRSGTSMTAGIFATLGLWTGTTVPGGPENPKGFFEHVALREQVTKGILAGHGFDPVGVRKLPPRDFNPNIRFNNSLTLRQTIEAIIRADGYEPHRPWMYKGAKMSLLWRMFDKAFPKAIWIVVSREREGFVKSCLKTSFMMPHSSDPDFWHQLADDYEERLTDLSKSVATVHHVKTDAVIQGDFTAIEKICLAHGLDYRADDVADFVSPQFWNTGSN